MHPAAAAQLRTVEAVLESLKRGQRQLTRSSRTSLEKAVTQLLATPARATSAASQDGGGSYRVDDLARVTGTTVRNIRAYQERGLLHPPTRRGRVAYFDDTHVARLKLINSMLERGYTSLHIREMLDAWEHGKTLADVLGIEQALVPAPHDPPVTMGLVAARELAGGADDLAQYAAAGLVEITGTRARVLRPQLLAAFAEMHGYGMTTAALLAIHRDVVPLVDQITEKLVSVGVAHLADHFTAPSDHPQEISELVTMLIRFRTLATSSVTATLDSSIERRVEHLLTEYLAAAVGRSSGAEPQAPAS